MTIRYKRPDKKNALSILESAKDDLKFTLTIKISDESGATIIRNIHNSFRMLGDSLLISKGIDPKDHITSIKELLKLNVKTSRPINLIDSVRRLRHNINYYGYRPKLNEVKDVISIAETCFNPLYEEVKKIVTGEEKVGEIVERKEGEEVKKTGKVERSKEKLVRKEKTDKKE